MSVVSEIWPSFVPIGYDCWLRYGPSNSESWIVPAHAACCSGLMLLRHEIDHICLVLERQKCAGATFGDYQQIAVGAAEDTAGMPLVGRGADPKIKNDVVCCPARAAYELVFLVR